MEKIKELKKEFSKLSQELSSIELKLNNIQKQIDEYKYPIDEYKKIIGKWYKLPKEADEDSLHYQEYEHYFLPTKIFSCDDCLVNIQGINFLYRLNEAQGFGLYYNFVPRYSYYKRDFLTKYFNDENIITDAEDKIKEIFNKLINK